ncbi:MAG: enoyl-CoA hydratase [Candidatus Hydrogenedentota bacterium]
MSSHLLVEIKNGIATLTMNRPEARNAFSDEMRKALAETFHDLELNDAVRCVVLKGAGDHFMAGGDVKGMAQAVQLPPDEIRKQFVMRIHDLHTIMFPMRRMAKPILASVRGAAAGAGVSMALCCDLVVASEDAFFTLAYCNIGTSPDGASTFHLPRTVSIKRAMEMALLGDRFTAQQARDMGLINWVVPTDKLDEETTRIATRLASGPTRALGHAKRLLYKSIETDFEAQLQAEAEAFAHSASGPDFKEGVMAFVEKRKPAFSGK